MMHDRIWTLLARKMANELLPQEEAELERLLQQHPDASYIKEMMMQPWRDRQRSFGTAETDMALERHKRRLESAMAAEEPLPRKGPRVRRLALQLAAAAAVLVFVVMVGRKWLPAGKPAEADTRRQLVTQKGLRSHVNLPDGSSVWLNAGSKLEYPKQFNGQQREVVLEGEAFFAVAKDADRPFIVRTRSISIRVLGTEFNVRAYPREDSAVTSLVSGAVEVVLDEEQNRVVLLRPNEKLSTPVPPTSGAPTAKPEPVTGQPVKSRLTAVQDSIIAETAWVDNKLAFRKMPLEKVAVLLEQWFDADIRFKNERKKELYLTGVFDKENLTEVLKALAIAGPFRFSQDEDGVVWIE